METFLEVAADLLARGDIQEAFVDSARFLYVYNSTTLVASVGSIVGMVLLGSLLWIAITAAIKDEKNYGNYYGGGYRRGRSTFDGHDDYGYSFVEQLNSIYEAFKKYDISGSDCQKRAICEAFLKHEEKDVRQFATLVQNTVRKIQKETPDFLDSKSAEFLKTFSGAADHGIIKKNCNVFKNQCPKSLQEFFRRKQALE